ncbi:hypothetical protein [Acidovorax sp. NCPPB 3576]|uniref:hypothetical protein n=1 Tax=Acidovorax sp. NCPPB 3576 TaxID=2940488 RepID=UPI00234BF055|nr:hypothetical protein [Acidovorax sp. NCPPB 3576]WCM88530.1 hypothetical protein M5C98_00240 [Acidovorax sp. NCPPB 3576]
MRTALALETAAAVAGMLGAMLLASAYHPGLGFGAFLLSNLGWLVWSSGHRHWRMFAQQVVFLVTSLVGLWNWWLGPLLLG